MGKVDHQIREYQIKFRCPVSGRIVTIDHTKTQVSAWQEACECCGSHGGADMYIRCTCGKEHTIDLESW